jgi:hypothetical protein
MMPRKMQMFGAAIGLFWIFAVVVPADAFFSNPSFETGDFSDWNLTIPPDGSAQVVTSHAGDTITYYPRDGSYFALLKTDGPGSYTIATQDVNLTAGEKIFGSAAFDARDSLPYNDSASVRILQGAVEVAVPWYADVNQCGDYGDCPWTYWEWTAPASGLYTLELRVTNADDSGLDSYALFDGWSAILVPALTPIGVLFFIMVLSLIALFMFRKSRQLPSMTL